MRKIVKRLLSIYLVLFLATNVFAAAPELTPELKERLQADAKVIEAWVAMPIFIDAVKSQNAKKLALDQIKASDAEWIKIQKAKEKPNALMEQILAHPVGEWLRQKNVESKGSYPEAFLCDNQGANVAVSKFTSDYWQGDEEKWIASFNNGKGAVFFGPPEFDDSTKSMQVQVSVPVMDQGKAIGVLVVGVKFSTLKK